MVAVAALVALRQEEVVVPDERVLVAPRLPVGERVARGPEPERAHARVEQILQQNVLGVLRSNGTSAQHGEASLHEEDERAAVQDPVHVDVGAAPEDGGLDGSQSISRQRFVVVETHALYGVNLIVRQDHGGFDSLEIAASGFTVALRWGQPAALRGARRWVLPTAGVEERGRAWGLRQLTVCRARCHFDTASSTAC